MGIENSFINSEVTFSETPDSSSVLANSHNKLNNLKLGILENSYSSHKSSLTITYGNNPNGNLKVDDGNTAFLGSELKSGNYRYFLESNIITNKLGGSRSDELKAGFMKDVIDFDGNRLDVISSIGLEFKSVGNFGGAEVQNFVHDLRGHPEVNLNYSDNEYTTFGLKSQFWINYDFENRFAYLMGTGNISITQDGASEVVVSIEFGKNIREKIRFSLGYQVSYVSAGDNTPYALTLDDNKGKTYFARLDFADYGLKYVENSKYQNGQILYVYKKIKF